MEEGRSPVLLQNCTNIKSQLSSRCLSDLVKSFFCIKFIYPIREFHDVNRSSFYISWITKNFSIVPRRNVRQVDGVPGSFRRNPPYWSGAGTGPSTASPGITIREGTDLCVTNALQKQIGGQRTEISPKNGRKGSFNDLKGKKTVSIRLQCPLLGKPFPRPILKKKPWKNNKL